MFKSNNFSTEKLRELLREACMKESVCWTERKSYPDTDDLVKSNERDEIVAFLLEVCDREDVSFSIETFSLFVRLLDRFLASYKVKSKYLECLAVACLYIASKLKEEDENISITSEFLMECDCKCSIAELLRMEMMILTKFEWNVNDVTHVDFLHIFYSLLVNKCKELDPSSFSSTNKQWRKNHSKSLKLNNKPIDLDFLPTLESQLKQLLCVNEMTTLFRPHVLAFSLLSLQVEKIFDDENLTLDETQAKKNKLFKLMTSIQLSARLIDDSVIEKCKEQIEQHLAKVVQTNELLDRYFKEYHAGVVMNFRQSLLSQDLPAIKEEDETEMSEQDVKAEATSAVLTNSLNNLKIPKFNRSMSCESFTYQSDCSASETYGKKIVTKQATANIIMKRKDQKRKISDGSSADDEDIVDEQDDADLKDEENVDCDHENDQVEL